MAILTVRELPQTRNFSVNEKNERTYQRDFQVITDSPHDGALAVAAAPGFSIGDQYVTSTESDNLAYVNEISSECNTEDGRQWTVSVGYGPLPEGNSNPLLEPAQVQWSFAQFQRPTDRDINGNAILNSAGDPFSEAVEIDDSRPVLSVTRNESVFNAQLAVFYRDAINGTPFFGGGVGQVKVSNISSSRKFDQTFGFYWTTNYEFHFNVQGWDKVLLDQGFRERDAGKVKNILVQGVPVNEPALLDGQGKQLPVGGQPQFKKFQVYPKLPFTVFNF